MYRYIILVSLLLAQMCCSINIRRKYLQGHIRSISSNDLTTLFLLKLEELQNEPDSPKYDDDRSSSRNVWQKSLNHQSSLPSSSFDFEIDMKRHCGDNVASCCLIAFFGLRNQSSRLQKKIRCLRGEVDELKDRLGYLEVNRSSGKLDPSDLSENFSLKTVEASKDAEFINGTEKDCQEVRYSRNTSQKEHNIDRNFKESIDDDAGMGFTALKPLTAESVADRHDETLLALAIDQDSELVESHPVCLQQEHASIESLTDATVVDTMVVENHISEPEITSVKANNVDAPGMSVLESSQSEEPLIVNVIKEKSVQDKAHLVTVFAIMCAMIVLMFVMIWFVVVFKRIDHRYGLSTIDSIASEQQMIAAATLK